MSHNNGRHNNHQASQPNEHAGPSACQSNFARRNVIKASILAAVSAKIGCTSAAGQERAVPDNDQANAKESNQLRFCLNTSTINGGSIPVRQQLKIAAQAGYDSVELWVRDIEKYISEGGQIDSLRNEMIDLGLTLDSAIAFGSWIVDDDTQRQAGLDQCRRDMSLIRQLGGSKIAAPPVGATNAPKLNLDDAAARYRQLLEIGSQFEVVPQLELWGFSHNLSTLAEVLYVAAAAEHQDACLLLDIYHLYKGGSDFQNITMVPASSMWCLHMNDYPAEPDRKTIADKDRVYPGDGIAPISDILRAFRRAGFKGTLSLELFNRDYWQQPPEDVARIGLEKMKQCVALSQ